MRFENDVMRERLSGLFSSMQDLNFTKALQDKYHALIEKTERQAEKLHKRMSEVEVEYIELQGKHSEQHFIIKELLANNAELLSDRTKLTT